MLPGKIMAAARAIWLSLAIPAASVMGQGLVESAPAGELGVGAAGGAGSRTGLLADRITGRGLEKWKAIEELVFSEGRDGQPLHPTLRSMWEWIETSGHAVHIEFLDEKRESSTSMAGIFSIEMVDPRGERHAAVIRLNLFNIDHAAVPEDRLRSGEFKPFVDLSGEERYAEVLGHEMAHAIYILTNPERTSHVYEMVEVTNRIILTETRKRGLRPVPTEMRTRISRRDEILQNLERVAEMMEKQVWKELISSKPLRKRGGNSR